MVGKLGRASLFSPSSSRRVNFFLADSHCRLIFFLLLRRLSGLPHCWPGLSSRSRPSGRRIQIAKSHLTQARPPFVMADLPVWHDQFVEIDLDLSRREKSDPLGQVAFLFRNFLEDSRFSMTSLPTGITSLSNEYTARPPCHVQANPRSECGLPYPEPPSKDCPRG